MTGRVVAHMPIITQKAPCRELVALMASGSASPSESTGLSKKSPEKRRTRRLCFLVLCRYKATPPYRAVE